MGRFSTKVYRTLPRQHSVGPDPTLIWYRWNPHIPDVGRIWVDVAVWVALLEWKSSAAIQCQFIVTNCKTTQINIKSGPYEFCT